MKRRLEQEILTKLEKAPSVEVIGPRQIGKTTLADAIANKSNSVKYDLSKVAVRNTLSDSPSDALIQHAGKLVILDEVQNVPNLYQELRSVIDELRSKGMGYGNFLLLGSATGKLQRQTNEPLTGRIIRLELQGIDWLETAGADNLEYLWDRGGYPNSYLAPSIEDSMAWRMEYLNTALNRDTVSLGLRVPAHSLRDLLDILASSQGGIANKSSFGSIMKVSDNTIGHYLEILSEMMLVRKLTPYVVSAKKRLVKSPKYYIRDSGLLHALLDCSISRRVLPQHERIAGYSWEGFVIENIMAVMPRHWRASYYRDHDKNEIDLVLQPFGDKPWAVEIKLGEAVRPTASCRRAMEELKPARAFQVHSGTLRQNLGGKYNVLALPLADLMHELLAQHNFNWSDIEPELQADIRVRLTELLKALDEGRHNVPRLRKEYIAEALLRIERIVGDCDGIPDAHAHRRWAKTRHGLFQWLDQESLLDHEDSPTSKYFEPLSELLQGVLAIKLANSVPEDSYKTEPTLAGWVTFDLFLNVLAALLGNGRHNIVGALLSDSYYYDGELYPSKIFWAAQSLKEEASGDLAKFSFQDSAVSESSLIKAELIAMLYYASTIDTKESKLPIWYPRLYNGELPLKLEFFVRSADRKAGMRNFLSCLNLPGDLKAYAKLKKNSATYISSKLGWTGFKRDNLLCAIGFAQGTTSGERKPSRSR